MTRFSFGFAISFTFCCAFSAFSCAFFALSTIFCNFSSSRICFISAFFDFFSIFFSVSSPSLSFTDLYTFLATFLASNVISANKSFIPDISTSTSTFAFLPCFFSFTSSSSKSSSLNIIPISSAFFNAASIDNPSFLNTVVYLTGFLPFGSLHSASDLPVVVPQSGNPDSFFFD